MLNRILYALLLLSPGLIAQITFVMPPKLANQAGNRSDSTIFMGLEKVPMQPVHIQLIYNSADVPFAAAPVQSISFRRPNYAASLPANPAATATMTIKMSSGPNDEATASKLFASNLGTVVTQVFQGKINLPSQAYSGPGAAAFNVKIPFNPPFIFTKTAGKGLVVDIVTSQYTPTASKASWLVDAQYEQGSGGRTTNGTSQVNCKFSTGKFSSSISSRPPKGPGYEFYYSLGSLLPNAPGLQVFGSMGVGSVWGPITLPLDLGPLGAPGCQWKVDILVAWPVTTDANGNLPYTTMIPNDPALIGAYWFEQCAIVDQAANALGLVTTWSSKWTIGNTPLPGGSIVYKALDTAGAKEGGFTQTAVVARFN